MFLEAAKIIHEKHPEVRFHLMGEGSLVHEIKSFIEENKLEDVVNFRFHKNPPEVFANTSIFVSLQTGTNYPSQSVLEAMACGNAIIASSVGDTEMFINKDNGVLIPLEINALVNAIENMISDKANTRTLGTNAREYALKNHTAEKYLEYFSGIVKKAYSMNFN
jgi:glycosyltransferase involved in cell wall biosynthesis